MSNPLSVAPLVPTSSPAEKPGPEPLIGKHITLERLNDSHFPFLQATIGSHPSLWTWWPDEMPLNYPAFTTYMNEFLQLMPDDLAIYSILPNSGEYAGQAVGLGMALSTDRTTNRIGEVGAFYSPVLQRTAGGTEVIYLMMKELFDGNHRRVGWKTNTLNLESRKAAERYGFIHEGTLRQDQINKGRSRDTALYSVIDAEWAVVGKAMENWLGEENFDEEGRQRRGLGEIREELKNC